MLLEIANFPRKQEEFAKLVKDPMLNFWLGQLADPSVFPHGSFTCGHDEVFARVKAFICDLYMLSSLSMCFTISFAVILRNLSTTI